MAHALRMTRASVHLRLVGASDGDPPPPAGGGSPPAWQADIAAIATHRDRDAFMRIYDHFWPRLVSDLARLGVAEGQAQELAQEALFKLWQRPDLFDPTHAALSTWIFRVARNLWIDGVRRDQRFAEADDAMALLEALPADPGDEARQQQETEERLAAALAALPPDQATVIRLSYYEARTQHDIATALGLPLGTVKSKIRLAFAKLRQALVTTS